MIERKESLPDLAASAPGPGAASTPDALVLLALGLLVRVHLVLAHPAIHGGDSVLRIARSHELFLGMWLPLPQLVVFVTRALAPDPFWARIVFALLGATAPVALAALVAATADRAAGRAAGALLALHPLHVYYSTVSYQEVVLFPLLLGGALALVRGREAPAGALLGLACLCRYEAWIAAALAGVTRLRRPLQAALLFGWAPLLWLLLWHGLEPPGSYVLDVDTQARRWSRLPVLFAKLREYSGDALPLLALAGAVVAWRRRDPRWAWGAAFVLLYLAGQVAVGHEHPPGSGVLNERMAHVPAAALCALGGLALGVLSERLAVGRARAPLGAALAAAFLAAMGLGWTRRVEELIVEANRAPILRLAVQVAGLADARLSPAGRLAVAAPPVPSTSGEDYERRVEDYIEKIRRGGGDVEKARAIAREWSRYSADYYWLTAHLPRPPRSVIVAGQGEAELVAVYDDAPDAARWSTGEVVARFTADGRGVTVYAPRRAPPR